MKDIYKNLTYVAFVLGGISIYNQTVMYKKN